MLTLLVNTHDGRICYILSMSEKEQDVIAFVVKAIKRDPVGGNDWYQLGPVGTYGQRAPREGELLKPANISDTLPEKK